MELDLALLADAANVSRENKLNLLGEFNTLFVPSVPASLPPSVLVLRVVAHANEIGAHTLGVRLRDSDGQLLWSSPDLPITMPQPDIEGLPVRLQVIAPINRMPFPDEGSYEFEVIIDGAPALTRDGQPAKGAEVHVVIRRPPAGQGAPG